MSVWTDEPTVIPPVRPWWAYQQAPTRAERLARALEEAQAAYAEQPTTTLGVTCDRLEREVRRAEEGRG